jgi:TPR repeat protein
MQQGLAHLELEAIESSKGTQRMNVVSPISGSNAAAPQQQYNGQQDNWQQQQPQGGAPRGFQPEYEQQNNSSRRNISPPSSSDRTALTKNYTNSQDIPLPSAFPKVINPSLSVPPSDDEKEEILELARAKMLSTSDAEKQLNWAQDVLMWADTAMQSRTREALIVPNRAMTPKSEHHLRQDALNIINHLAGQGHPKADFIKGTWYEFGKFGYPIDTKESFAAYRRSAEQGYARAEYRIGTQYESSKDMPRAIRHYSVGASKGDSASNYRLGMMTLLGQYGHPQNYQSGVEQIKQAADTADENAPQGAYVYGMLLARELPNISLPENVLPYDLAQAKNHIERAAYIGFAKAQIKMGQAYELCQLGCDFNPALSLHYNHLAARQGEPEAEMAISKWFLCGYEGIFEKNEALAFTYAQRAAQKEFPTAEFALGYFYEIGMYIRMDLGRAREWYQKAADHGNKDALARIESLQLNQTLTKKDHEEIAITRIKSQYGSRRGQRPAHLKERVAPLPTMVEDPSNPPTIYGHGQNGYATGVDGRDQRPDSRPISVATYDDRFGVPVLANGQRFRANSGGNLISPTSAYSPSVYSPVRPKSTAPYPEDDIAPGPGRGQSNFLGPNQRPLTGPPADRPNSAFGIRPLHGNTQFSDPRSTGIRPASSMGNMSVPEGRGSNPQGRIRVVSTGWEPQQPNGYRQNPLLPDVPRKAAPGVDYSRPQDQRPQSQQPHIQDGRNRLQKQDTGFNKPTPPIPSFAYSEHERPLPPIAQTRLDSLPPRSSSAVNQQRPQQKPAPGPASPEFPGWNPQRPTSSYAGSASSSPGLAQSQFPPRRTSMAPQTPQSASTLSPGVTSPATQSQPQPPKKEGPKTFDEMGIPAQAKESDCVSLAFICPCYLKSFANRHAVRNVITRNS